MELDEDRQEDCQGTAREKVIWHNAVSIRGRFRVNSGQFGFDSARLEDGLESIRVLFGTNSGAGTLALFASFLMRRYD